MATKTIAIIGITGNQGSSVADVFLSTPGWHVRGLTRNPTSPSAQSFASKGAEIVRGDLDDPSSLKSAFAGAHAIFGNTDFWVNFGNPATHEEAAKRGVTPNEIAFEKEVEQGKRLIDVVAELSAAEGAVLERFVVSTLSDSRGISGGKVRFNLHFDAKAAQIAYLKEKYPKLWGKTSRLQLGMYATNWKAGGPSPQKVGEGKYVVGLPVGGDTKIPWVDPGRDTGHFVKALVSLPPGLNLVGAGSYISWNEYCAIWGKHTNVECVFEKQDRKIMEEALGPLIGREIADMFEYVEEFGYDGREKDAVYPWELKNEQGEKVEVKYTTMEESRYTLHAMDPQQSKISVSITTSTPTLDLSKHDPFIITITLTLHASHPITFNERLAYLFDGNLLCDDGIVFTNTATQEQVSRDRIQVCYDSDAHETPTEGKEGTQEFITLVPGEPHVIEAKTIRPHAWHVWPKHVNDMKGMTQEEIAEKKKAMGVVWSWYGIEGLEDGQEYELGIAEDAAVRCWLQGSVEGLLEVKKLGLTPTVRWEEIRYVAERTARFVVKRPNDVVAY
ncbi:NAD(P)-binding protein [Lophiostoma macrostomum CBS 122681]|uniref:NAD(P)-binding protein n=1 Tax=Lophiostoma macrostomum CBS 122681 TaxID=1314788 RepID=A0A6A6SYW7_9PLEO|nr:NAD(P)-binding protein [Lophiostoma macrostomum CBS 122681]